MLLLAQLEAAKSSSALARLAEPWNSLYSDSKLVSSTVVFLHLVPLLVAGGTALVADRATLRAARGTMEDRARHLIELGRTHAFVLAGLALSFVSGVLMFLSDVDTFLESPFFWIKLALVGLLLVNGFLMTRTEHALNGRGDDGAMWSRMTTIAVVSLVLWLATTLAGVVLMTYA